MRLPASIIYILYFLCAIADVNGRERNAWPVLVQQANEAGDRVGSWTAAGPLLFSRSDAEGETVSGLRPFWLQTKDERGKLRSALVLYPLFSWSADDETYRWSVYELIRRSGQREAGVAANPDHDPTDSLEIWPFWFSRQTGDPDTSYRGLFPVAGTLKGRLGFERISWLPFPLYVQMAKRGATTTMAPWPFVRVTRGAAHGFALWPLFGWQERPGELREAFYLWPLGYNITKQPPEDAPADTPPAREIGALPFYTRSTAPGLRSENFLWPFFGYTHRTAPMRYHETRYFWPFLVQGRGENRYVNRWGPFYTHSINKGYDKTWYAWPIYRRLQSTADGLTQTKNQVGIFLYWSLEQRSATNPDLAPASVRHLWPFFSAWDDGAGRRQFQFPSPLEVFFPGNEKMRNTWTPLFSLYRHDRRANGSVRASLLWNGITWERDSDEDRKAFHLGPLVGMERDPQRMRFDILHGLIGVSRVADRRSWRVFWVNFPARKTGIAATKPATSKLGPYKGPETGLADEHGGTTTRPGAALRRHRR